VTRSNVKMSNNPRIHECRQPNRDHFLPAFRFGQHALKMRSTTGLRLNPAGLKDGHAATCPDMKRHTVSFLILLSVCSGCGTVNTHTSVPEAHNPQGPYDGVRFDWQRLSQDHHADAVCFYALDLPISALADTMFLPLDLGTPMTPGTSNTLDAANGTERK
jgi:uncharacterized protein YceK